MLLLRRRCWNPNLWDLFNTEACYLLACLCVPLSPLVTSGVLRRSRVTQLIQQVDNGWRHISHVASLRPIIWLQHASSVAQREAILPGNQDKRWIFRRLTVLLIYNIVSNITSDVSFFPPACLHLCFSALSCSQHYFSLSQSEKCPKPLLHILGHS